MSKTAKARTTIYKLVLSFR